MPKKKDLWLIVGILGVAVVLLALSRLLPSRGNGIIPSAPLDENVSLAQLPSEAEGLPENMDEKAAALEEELYLVVSVGDMRSEPILLTGETEYTLNQSLTGMQNVICVSEDSIWMASSSCDNQDCVQQGTISADNRHTRILGNMIICLPNAVMLEMLSRDEIEEVLP